MFRVFLKMFNTFRSDLQRRGIVGIVAKHLAKKSNLTCITSLSVYCVINKSDVPQHLSIQ